MIRHIVLIRCTGPVTDEQVGTIRSALATCPAPGRTGFWMGPDLGLRDANMDLAIVADFEDENAFRAYDRDNPEHDRIRRDLIGPIAEGFERCQFAF